MNKTFNINLGGIVYHIDEDAYDLLENYLKNLRIYFSKEEGGEEIVQDMELRISELFTERIHAGKQVITLSDVEEIIAQMGNFEEITDESEESGKDKEENDETPKRLYRDADNKIFGGVCSGIAAYMGWDTTILRLAMLLVCCFLQGGILLYIISWIIIPLAKTAPEKLSMRGKKINVKNIGETVTDKKDKSNVNTNKNQSKSLLYKIGEVIVSVCTIIIKVVLVLLGIVLIPVMLALFLGIFIFLLTSIGVITHLPFIITDMMPINVDWSTLIISNPPSIFLSISGLLVVALPLIGIIHLLLSTFGNWRPMPVIVKIILTVIWIIAFFATIIGFACYTDDISSMMNWNL